MTLRRQPVIHTVRVWSDAYTNGRTKMEYRVRSLGLVSVLMLLTV